MRSYIIPYIQKCLEILPDQFTITSSTPMGATGFTTFVCLGTLPTVSITKLITACEELKLWKLARNFFIYSEFGFWFLCERNNNYS